MVSAEGRAFVRIGRPLRAGGGTGTRLALRAGYAGASGAADNIRPKTQYIFFQLVKNT